MNDNVLLPVLSCTTYICPVCPATAFVGAANVLLPPIVTKKLLQIYRKHAFVIVLILSSIITPPDVLSQILIAFPLMILYEISIIVVHSVHKKNKI